MGDVNVNDGDGGERIYVSDILYYKVGLPVTVWLLVGSIFFNVSNESHLCNSVFRGKKTPNE